MDLLSSIRKEGSRGGVDFKWSDVSTSQHRENYLGHSLMAPVGRWQKNRDLSWYAKADSDAKVLNKDGKEESAEEKKARERKEEIRRIKEAEEDALARALGLPVLERVGGMGTGANNIDVGEMKRVIKETEAGDDEIEEVGRGRGFGDFVGRVGVDSQNNTAGLEVGIVRGGLQRQDRAKQRRGSPALEDRNRSRSQERRRRQHRRRDRSRSGGDRHRHRDHDDRTRERRGSDERPSKRRDRFHSPSRRERRYRSRSPERHLEREKRNRSRSRSRSPRRRDRRNRDRSTEHYRSKTEDGKRRSPEGRTRSSQSPKPRGHDRDHEGRKRWR